MKFRTITRIKFRTPIDININCSDVEVQCVGTELRPPIITYLHKLR